MYHNDASLNLVFIELTEKTGKVMSGCLQLMAMKIITF